MSSLHRTQIYLDVAQIEALDARAKALGTTRSDLIRTMIHQGLAADDARPSLFQVLSGAIDGAPQRAEQAPMFGVRTDLEAELQARQNRWARQREGKED